MKPTVRFDWKCRNCGKIVQDSVPLEQFQLFNEDTSVSIITTCFWCSMSQEVKYKWAVGSCGQCASLKN